MDIQKKEKEMKRESVFVAEFIAKMASVNQNVNFDRDGLLDAGKAFKNGYVHLSYGMSHKMRFILSMSTSNLINPICKARKLIKGSICEKCFADSTCKQYESLDFNTVENYWFFNGHECTKEELYSIAGEIVAALYKNGTNEFRLESFGDLGSKLHAKNYIHLIHTIRMLSLAIGYPVYIGFWTKNVNILSHAFIECSPAERNSFRKIVHLLISSMFENEPMPEDEKKRWEKAFRMPVSVFTVYDSNFIKENGVKVNCGARSCHTCLSCYRLKDRGCYKIEEEK